MSAIAERLDIVRERVAESAARAGRTPQSCRLVAVSKGHPNEAIVEAWHAGQRLFGESYVQEFATRRDLNLDDVAWHFIGRIQRNKVRDLVDAVDLMHAVDRPELVAEIGKRAGTRDGANAGAPVRVLLQVNVAGEDSKAGVAPDLAGALLRDALATPGVLPVGLMTVAPLVDDPELVRPVFRALRDLQQRLRDELARDTPGAAAVFTELSMGMSDDLAVAVAEGSTLVRVGTAIFGARSYDRP